MRWGRSWSGVQRRGSVSLTDPSFLPIGAGLVAATSLPGTKVRAQAMLNHSPWGRSLFPTTAVLHEQEDKQLSEQTWQRASEHHCSALPALDSDRRQHTALWGSPLPTAQPTGSGPWNVGQEGRGQAMFGAGVLRQNENGGKRGKWNKTKSSVLCPPPQLSVYTVSLW